MTERDSRFKISRRNFLNVVSGGLAAPVFISRSSLAWADSFNSDPFSLGVASGDPYADSVVIWTRIAPEPLQFGSGVERKTVNVDWVVCSDENMSHVVAQGEVQTSADAGYSVHVVVQALRPARHYWYQFRCAGAISQKGRTKTLPALGSRVESFVLAAAGCQKFQDGYFTLWRDIANTNVDLVFHYGDYIYGGRLTNEEISARLGRPMLSRARRQRTLDNYRLYYSVYKLDPDLAAAQAAHPFVVSFDDHEVDNNWAGADEKYSSYKRAALQAYFENMPLRPAVAREDGSLSMQRMFFGGSLLRFAVLDSRQYRSPLACAEAYAPCLQRFAPGRTMLGADQETWLDNFFARGGTTWTVIGNQVQMMQERAFANPDPQAIHSTDKWDGFPAARQRLLTSASRSDVSGLVVLSGDRHSALAGYLTQNFDDERSPAIGVELLASSVSSGGDGKPQGGSRIMRANSHIRMFDNRRGTLVCSFREKVLEAEFRYVDAVSRRGMPIKILKRFEIDPRRPEL